MTTNVDQSGPWYHYFWPWFIVVLLGTTVLAGIVTVIIAVRGADSLVVDDYYRDGKAINQTFAADREAELREAVARLRFDRGASVELEILGEAPAALMLDLSHVTRAELDLHLLLERTSTGNYVTHEVPPDGHFYATLRPSGRHGTWRLRRRIELPADRSILLEPEG